MLPNKETLLFSVGMQEHLDEIEAMMHYEAQDIAMTAAVIASEQPKVRLTNASKIALGILGAGSICRSLIQVQIEHEQSMILQEMLAAQELRELKDITLNQMWMNAPLYDSRPPRKATTASRHSSCITCAERAKRKAKRKQAKRAKGKRRN